MLHQQRKLLLSRLVILAVLLSLTIAAINDEHDSNALVITDNDEAEVQITEESFEFDPNIPEFTATTEWKDILPGQRVPAGLHYRLDLSTGKKQAKLLDPQLKTGKRTLSEKRRAKLEVIADELKKQHEAKSTLDHDELPHHEIDNHDFNESDAGQPIHSMQDAMDANKDHWTPPEIPEGGTDFRSILKELLSAPAKRQLELLEKIEHAVHEGESAREFTNAKGLPPILQLLDGATNEAVGKTLSLEDRIAVATAACGVLGIAAQNNLEVQEAVFAIENPSAIDRLMALLAALGTGDGHQMARSWLKKASDKQLLKMRRRAIFALGVLLRPSLTRQDVFLSTGGTDLLLHLMASGDRSLARKALTLMTDMIFEALADQHNRKNKDKPLSSVRVDALIALGNMAYKVPLQTKLTKADLPMKVAHYASHEDASSDDVQLALELLTLLQDKAEYWPVAERINFKRALKNHLNDWRSEAEDEYFNGLVKLGDHVWALMVHDEL